VPDAFYTCAVPFPLVFCAPTLAQARLAAWTFVSEQKGSSPLDPPLILGRHAGAGAWRDLARAQKNGRNALILPRLVTPDRYFARAHSANARQKFWGGLNRLWTLAKTLRTFENRLEHLDFDADDTDALREMAALIALLRRQNLSALPVGDDPLGRELESWRIAYDEELERLDAFDFEAAPALFPLGAGANRAFSWPRTLVLDDGGEVSPALEVGLAALFSRADRVVGTMAIPGGHEEEIARRTRAFWTRHGAQFVEEQGDSPRAVVARQLLDPAIGRPAIGRPAPSLPPDVWLTQAHTTGDEAGRIAAHIRREVENGASARDFCLLVPDPSVQERPLRAAFGAAGVPLDWPDSGAARGPLFERLTRLLVPRAVRGVDELHDLLGDGALRLEWSGDDGQLKRFDAGRLRRAHRCLRGEEEGAPWRDPELLSRDWETRIARLRASNAGRGDQTRAETLASSLDGGDLQGVARLKQLLAPLAEPLPARDWETAALALADALAAHWEDAPSTSNGDPLNGQPGQETDSNNATFSSRSPFWDATATPNTCNLPAAPLEHATTLRASSDNVTSPSDSGRVATLQSSGDQVGAFVSGDQNTAEFSSRAETASRTESVACARVALDAFRAGVRAVAERAGDERAGDERAGDERAGDERARPSSAWTAWLRLEVDAEEDETARARRGAGVRVLRVGEVGEAATDGARGVFVVGLSERAWPKPRPVSWWPRATALRLETLREHEAPPLSLALHGFARLMALPCPLFLSRAAWTAGTESGASPLWEDLSALFPGAAWPSLAPAEDAPIAFSRSHWLQTLARECVARGQNGEAIQGDFAPLTLARPAGFDELSEVHPVDESQTRAGTKERASLPRSSAVNRIGEADEHQTALETTADLRGSSGQSEPETFSQDGFGPNETQNLALTDADSLKSTPDLAFIEDPELRARLLALDAMRRGRASLDQIGHYDGVLGERGQALLQPLLSRDEERLVVSPSGIEGYVRCPIRFFFERVLRLPDDGGTEDDLSRAESGDLVHRVLHAFRREWKTPLGMDLFESAREAVAHLTRRECDSLGLPPILRRAEARRLIGTLERPGSLVRLLRAECLEADAHGRGVWAQALYPLLHLASGSIESATEGDWTLAHGGNGLEQTFRLPLRGASVQGRIDRIDASADGSLVVVLDYKTGSSSSLPSFAKGSDRLGFQLAVYLLAAGELVREWKSAPQIAASYLSPRVGFAGWTAQGDDLGEAAKNPMKSEVMTQWLADSRVQIERIASLIEAGTFNLSLRSAKVARCDGCACRALCGQNAPRQTARAGVHLGSNVVFLPERIEWETE